MKLEPKLVCAALLVLTVLAIVLRFLRHEEVPGVLIGLAGALCGILVHILREERGNSHTNI